MSITRKVSRSPASQHRVSLVVTAERAALHVGAGSVVVSGIEYALSSEQTYTLTTRALRTQVIGYLVRNRDSGAVAVLVDEIVTDGADVPFDFAGSRWEQLHMLYSFAVPANVDDLTDLAIDVWTIEAPVEAASVDGSAGVKEGEMPTGAELLRARLRGRA